MVVRPLDLTGGSSHADFAAFFEKNKTAVFRALLALHMNREAAEDAIAEAFARAFMGCEEQRERILR
jgi:DNA-directed RNA polymerase specialized sigma24 family protein